MQPHLRLNMFRKWECLGKVDSHFFYGTGDSPEEAYHNCQKLMADRLGTNNDHKFK